MKKLYFLTVSIFLIGFSLSAQDVKFGVIGGINLSNVDYTSTYFDYSSRISFHAGVYAEIDINSKFSFKPEILYASIGQVYKGDLRDYEYYGFDSVIYEDASFKSVYKNNYLQIPLSVKWNLLDNFSLNFGPQLGFLLNSVIKSTGLNENEKHEVSGDIELDYGATLGVSYNLTEEIVVGVRYYRGFKNLYQNSFIEDHTKAYNSVFQFSASYAIF